MTRLILQLFYPFIRYFKTFFLFSFFVFNWIIDDCDNSFCRGKIIYTPRTPAFDSVIQLVNETFQDLRIVQRFADRWLTEISPSIKRFLDQLDPEMIKNITGVITERFPVIANLTSSLTNTSDQIIRWVKSKQILTTFLLFDLSVLQNKENVSQAGFDR